MTHAEQRARRALIGGMAGSQRESVSPVWLPPFPQTHDSSRATFPVLTSGLFAGPCVSSLFAGFSNERPFSNPAMICVRLLNFLNRET